MKYIKSIDSIRAIAVLLVIICHWFGENHKLSIITGIVNGVDIFFVLSGFLITRILLYSKNAAEQSGEALKVELRNFFFRRVLRIFPIYYLTIFSLYFIGPGTGTAIRENFIYFFTYTANIYFIRIESWDGMLSHLWSLSVEEQFYLIWPLITLFIKRQYLLKTILIFIFIGIISQYMTDVGGMYTFACFDALGLGALLAWIVSNKPEFLKTIYKPLLFVTMIAIVILSIRMAGFYFDLGFNPFKVPIRTLTSIITVWLLVYILLSNVPRIRIVDWLLQNRTLMYIGKISYGIYLYHLILPHFTNPTLSNWNAKLITSNSSLNFYLLRMENFIILVIFALLSYRFIEMPFLRQKKYFLTKRESKPGQLNSNVLVNK